MGSIVMHASTEPRRKLLGKSSGGICDRLCRTAEQHSLAHCTGPDEGSKSEGRDTSASNYKQSHHFSTNKSQPATTSTANITTSTWHKANLRAQRSTILLALLITLQLASFHRPTVVECTGNNPCDFEKYITGCYSSSNLVCDRDTYTCQCLPQFPVLINGRICVKTAKPNESCNYDDQCDTEAGYRCVRTASGQSPGSPKNQYELCDNHGGWPMKCKCLDVIKLGLEALSTGDGSEPDSLPVMSSESAGPADQRTSEFVAVQPQNFTRGYAPWRSRGHTSSAHHQQQHQPKHSSQAHDEDEGSSATSKHHNSGHHSHHHHHSTGSIFSRIVWIFLILALISLMLLLLVIKYHSSFGAQERPFHHRSDDRTSFNSDLDVPPPYEVAIRMKV